MNYLKTLTDLYRLKKNVKLSAKKMKSLQDGKLRKLLRFAWEHSAYYRSAQNVPKTIACQWLESRKVAVCLTVLL